MVKNIETHQPEGEIYLILDNARYNLFLHQKLLYDHYYETFPEFKEAVENFFTDINTYKEELKTRLTDSFQVIPA